MALAGSAAGASAAAGATATTSLAPRGAWSWFSDPRAIQFGRYTVFGFVDGRGDVRIRAYGAGRLRGTVLQHRVGKDDHLNPAFLVRRDGRLQAFWTRHGKSHIYYRVARRPGQVMGFGPVHRLRPQHHAHFTYANPMYARGRIMLFFRGRGRDPALTTSRDGGHWTRGERMLSAPGPRRPYVKYATNGSDVFMAFTQAHPGELHKRPTGIFFARYRRGSFFTAAGAPLGKPPLRPEAAQPVYHGKDPAWIYDLALDERGRPVIVYAVLHTSRDHRYRYAAWDGHRWRDHHITGAGPHISRQRAGHVIETRYSAGVTLDHQNPRNVYLSRRVGAHFELERWRTNDLGATWSWTALTPNPASDNLRPVVPWGRPARGALDLLWMRGDYPSYLTFRTSVVGRVVGTALR